MAGASALDEELSKSPVVRLRGLPFSATESEIKEFFKDFELAPEGVVIQLNLQGRPTGQAFVQFTTSEEADKALSKNRQYIGTRYVEVFKGHLADMEGAQRMVGGGGGAVGGGGSGGYGLPGAPGGAPGADAGAAGAASGIPGMGGSADLRFTGVVRMRGMPYSCTEADITIFFKGMTIAPGGILLTTHPDGRPSGEAFVEFVDEETAARALQLHREPMGSRYVELFRSSKGEMVAALQKRMYGGMYGGAAMQGAYMGAQSMMGYGMPGVSAANIAAMQQMAAYNSAAAVAAAAAMPGQAAGMGQAQLAGMGLGVAGHSASAGATLSDNVCIKMRGLPYSASAHDILLFFQGYQVVDNGIHVVMGPGDRPSGEAYVEFASSEEAQRAMEKNRQHVGSRYVELFRVTKSEALLAVQGASMASFNMAAAMDPNMQLLLLQQQQLQAAAAMGMGGGQGGMSGSAGLQNTWGAGMGRPM